MRSSCKYKNKTDGVLPAMSFDDFAVGQTFTSSFVTSMNDFKNYLSFAHTKNIIHERPEIAATEGIKGVLLPGRSVLSRAEGEMTHLSAFSNCMMLLYGMDGDNEWSGTQARFMGEVYAGDTLEAPYEIKSKKNAKGYGILRVDYEISKAGKPVIVPRGNLYRIKK